MARNSSRAFRKTAAYVIARDAGICGICGHGDAHTADHIIPYRNWPKDDHGRPLPGLDSPDNMRAAHGTRGPAEHNPCYQCTPQGRYCNQSRGAGNRGKTQHTEPHSRTW
jgi:5-methylcytosine-specific restriction endonuclease McrA